MTRAAAEARYRMRRALAFQAAEAKLAAAGIVAELRPLDASALAAFAAQWRGHPTRRVAWPWSDMAADWRRACPERFELAVWSGGQLCALALGRPAPSARHLALHYQEGSPNPAHPLRGRVTAVVLIAAEAYALVLGKTELRLVEPLPALVSYYCSPALGFHLVSPPGAPPYCTRRIEP